MTTKDEELEDLRRKDEWFQAVKHCARCGGDHDEMKFTRLSHPSAEWTHWAPCPTNGEPLMLQITWGGGE